tara:strand:- start:763 stop:921 length:159 start_codon:yes stop_codon:yes gene_type:complete
MLKKIVLFIYLSFLFIYLSFFQWLAMCAAEITLVITIQDRRRRTEHGSMLHG